jgi:hypothetical protein
MPPEKAESGRGRMDAARSFARSGQADGFGSPLGRRPLRLDKRQGERLNGCIMAFCRAVILTWLLLCCELCCEPLRALVGGATPGEGTDVGRHVVLIVGSWGTSCSAGVIASDLLLTAAHCVLPGAKYKLVAFDAGHQPLLKDIVSVATHPRFDLASLLGHRATADVAILKLAAALPADQSAAALAGDRPPIQAGRPFLVAGYGLAIPGDGKSGGTLRIATLASTGHPNNLQLRLVDPATGGGRAGLGACTGDSGAPVFDLSTAAPAIIGIVSWSTGPSETAGCGGLTGVTPLTLYHDWILDTARRMGSPIGL